MAVATASAMAGSSSAPCLMVFCSALKTGLERRSRWTASLNTRVPYSSLTCVSLKLMYSSRGFAVAMAWMTLRRPFSELMGSGTQLVWGGKGRFVPNNGAGAARVLDSWRVRVVVLWPQRVSQMVRSQFPGLQVEIEVELVGHRPQVHGCQLALPLVSDPRLDQVRGE